MRPQPPIPIRPSEELFRLQKRCDDLERRVKDLEGLLPAVEHLQETIDQMMGVFECGKHPAPVFLRWDFEKRLEDSRQEGRARFVDYLLEVIDWPAGVHWEIYHKGKSVAIGFHPYRFTMALDEAEEALRRLIQEKQTKEVTPST